METTLFFKQYFNIYFLIVILIVCIGLVWLLLGKIRKTLSVSKWVTIFILRILILVLLAIIIFEPVIIWQSAEKLPVKIAILIDNTLSMSLKDTENKSSRFNNMKKDIKRFINLLDDDVLVKMYNISDNTERIYDLDDLKLKYKKTDISNSLMKVLDNELNDSVHFLKQVVLFSDGRHNTGNNPGNIAAYYPVPINTVVYGNPNLFKDVFIEKVSVSDVVFRNKPVLIDVMVNIIGYRGKKVKITLTQGNKTINSKMIYSDKKFFRKEIPIRFTPKNIGKYKYIVKLTTFSDEINKQNNRKVLNIEVLRDKIRVFFICGQPSWEYRFVRELMKNDPHIDLVSFVILRNRQNELLFPENELSLIPFPIRDILTKEIFNFDLIIFQNFSSNLYIYPSYLTNLYKAVVNKGAAFLLTGGNQSFSIGNYQHTIIDKLLPVELMPQSNSMINTPFKVKVNKKNLYHPIVRFGKNNDETEKIWKNMPQITGTNRVLRSKKDGVVLLEHSSLKDQDNNPLPVFVVGEKGNGRVGALMLDSTWRWALPATGRGVNPLYFQKFWFNIVRWLVKEKDFKQVNIFLNKDKYLPLENVDILVSVKNHSYNDVRDANVKIEITGPEKKLYRLEALGREKQEIIDGKPILKYLYECKFIPKKTGMYKIRTFAYQKEYFCGEDIQYFEVTKNLIEFNNAMSNYNLMESIAELTEGKHIRAADDDTADELMNIDFSPKKSLKEFKRENLWDNIFALILFVMLLCTEWFLRKKWGLI